MTAKIKFPHRKMPDEIILSAPIRCYDNGGKTADRYTVVYMDQPEFLHNCFSSVGMSGKPFHPQGVGMHSIAAPGWHLGKRVKFEELPADCQKLVRQDLTPNWRDLDEFVTHYIITALWSSNDESTDNGGVPLDVNYGIEDCAPEFLAAALHDCTAFRKDAEGLLADWTDEQAGYDFWLTRCGHGAGFWDRDKEKGNEITEIIKEKYPNVDLYVGDDKKIYC